MTTELRHLHAFRAAAAEPDDDARATARATLLAEIEAAAEPAARPAAVARPAPPARPEAPAAPRRPVRHRRLLAGLGGLAAAGAAAVAIALGTGVGGGDVQPQPATASEVLRRAADAAAAAQPYAPLRPGQYWYVRTEGDGLRSAFLHWREPEQSFMAATFAETRETWWAERGRGRSRIVIRGRPRFPNAAARRAWIAGGRPWRDDVHDEATPPSGRPGADLLGVLTPAALAALPTDPDMLAAHLRAEVERRLRDWPGEQPAEAARATTLSTLLTVLRQQVVPTPPELRAALFQVLARLPGSETRGEAADALGRRGVVVAWDDSAVGERLELVIEPVTGTLLEERRVRTRTGWLDHRYRTAEMREPAGTVIRTTYVASGVVDSVRARP